MSDDLDLDAIVHALQKQWRLLLWAPPAVGVVAIGITFLIAPTFTASTTVMPPAQQSSSGLAALAGVIGGLAGSAGSAVTKNPVDQYVALLKSRNVENAIIARFNLKEIYGLEYAQELQSELEENTVITIGKKEGFISVAVSDHDPARAAKMANAYVEELQRINKEFAFGEASQRRAYFEAQLKSSRDALADAESALNASGVSTRAMNAAPQSAVAAVARIKAAVSAQELKIVSMRSFAGDENPLLKQANNELTALRGQLALIEEGSTEPSDPSRYIEKYRNFKYSEYLFEFISKQYEAARLDEGREGAVIQIIDLATVPELKSKPKRLQVAATASVASAFILALGVLLRSYQASFRFITLQKKSPHVE